ncbi:Uncharacterised protein [Mycobacterium tuberculosis]|nr:Uncharacterised protein [Mycobacterium tuberculosis]
MTNRPPSTFSRSSALTCASSAARSAPSTKRRSTSLWNSANTMSQMRGTKHNSVGRTRARSSNSVDRSLLATK